MINEKFNQLYGYLHKPILIVLSFASCFLFRPDAVAQTFVVSFPVGSTVYQGSEIPMTVVIAGVKCEKTVIKCHKGLVSMIGDCKYIYRCKTVGIDTVEVFIHKGGKMDRIGEQVFEVKKRPLPQASLAGAKGGKIAKGALQVQQGIGAEFYIAGNHWESCTIDSFNLLILRNGKLELSTRNKGNLFTEETKAVLQKVQPGDIVLITDIKGCSQQSSGELKSLEFTIE